MAEYFEFRVDEEQKPLTKEEIKKEKDFAMAIIRWAFADEIKAMREANNG